MLSEYDRYLKIYDLRKEKNTWSCIARKIYPGDDEPFNAVTKCKNNYKACLKIVKGGYKHMR